VKCEVQASERDPVLCIHLMREKFGGPSGKITGIRLNKSSGVQISAKRPLSVRDNTNSGWSWAPPAFGNEAGTEVSFSAHNREVFVDFWVASDRQRQFVGDLLLSYNRPIFKTKRIKIYAETLNKPKFNLP